MKLLPIQGYLRLFLSSDKSTENKTQHGFLFCLQRPKLCHIKQHSKHEFIFGQSDTESYTLVS